MYFEDCTILMISICFLKCEISLLTVDCLSIAGMEPVEFHSVTRVGSGYSICELTELIKRLLPHWQQVIPGQCPSGLVWTKEKPDVWIAPQNSYILEVYFQLCFFLWHLRIWIAWHWNKYENYEVMWLEIMNVVMLKWNCNHWGFCSNCINCNVYMFVFSFKYRNKLWELILMRIAITAQFTVTVDIRCLGHSGIKQTKVKHVAYFHQLWHVS